MIRLQVIEGSNASNQIPFCAFHSFLVEVQTNAGYIHATHALGLQAPLVARNLMVIFVKYMATPTVQLKEET